MPGLHAVLSPSDAARWISCPAAISLDATLPVQEGAEDSPYAQEGTCAHVLAEIKAARHFGLITNREADLRLKAWERSWSHVLLVNEERLPEMHRYTDAYVTLLSQIVAETGGTVALEQRLFSGIPGCWGTSDATITSPSIVVSVDFKYGAGVSVSAEGNPQLRLYALGVLDKMDVVGTVERVRMVVFQPRIGNYVGVEELSADDLRAWRDTISPIAAEALAGSDRFGPSEKACRWCSHSGNCAAQAAQVFAEPWYDQDPRLLSPEQMAEHLARLPLLRDWMAAFEQQALTAAYSLGKVIPGWKVVRSGGRRHWTDEQAAINHMVADGYMLDEVTNTKIKGLGDLEKLMGAKAFAEFMAPFLHKPPGQPSLAPEDDSRPAIEPNTEAVKAFTVVNENEEFM